MKPELLAPAGDLERLKIALLYGADAVYVGGRKFSLRSRASNFTLPQIREGVAFAHARGKRVYVTANIIFHDEDLAGLDEYLNELEAIGVDAVIASSPYVIDRAASHPQLAFHLSTQQSVTNSVLVDFWAKRGTKRVVLARELSLAEIRQIRNASPVELEVFIHGGMCSSYSGRCTLSNDMTDRDANRGGCAHSCRWSYDLVQDQNKWSEAFDFTMAAKDLQTLRFIPELMALGISALKIEGRMKSPHYIATVVGAYRQVLDDAEAGVLKDWSIYEEALGKAENRKTSIGFFNGTPTAEQQLYEDDEGLPSQEFVGLVLDFDSLASIATLSQRNVFSVGDTLEHLTPGGPSRKFVLQTLTDAEGVSMERANHAKQTVKISAPWPMHPYDLIRKVF